MITPRVLEAWESSISADVARVLEDLAPQRVVYARPAWDRLLFQSFSRLFFGIAPDSEEFQKLESEYGVIRLAGDRRISIPWLPSERRSERALRETTRLLRTQTAPDCVIAELRANPEFRDSEQAYRMLVLMLSLAGSDIAGLVQWLVKTVCDFPDRVQESDPRWIVLETLRRHQVEHLYRRVLDDIEWEGFRIPKGWLLRICLADAHRDESVFKNAADFEPQRFAPGAPSQSEFLPFGAFRRSCIGENITHIFAREFLVTLLRDWDVKQIGESHEDYHAWHWTPGSDFRIRVQPK
jgi:cytochrome P450